MELELIQLLNLLHNIQINGKLYHNSHMGLSLTYLLVTAGELVIINPPPIDPRCGKFDLEVIAPEVNPGLEVMIAIKKILKDIPPVVSVRLIKGEPSKEGLLRSLRLLVDANVNILVRNLHNYFLLSLFSITIIYNQKKRLLQ